MTTANNPIQDIWPPPYTIRFSKKAKYISFKITPQQGLEVIVPSFRKRFNILALLEERKIWIKKNLVLMQQTTSKKSTKQQLPKILSINAAQEIWHIAYIEADNKNIKIIEQKNYLTLYGKIEPVAVQAILIKWLKKYARHFFHLKLAHLSKKTSLTYQQLTIRNQQTLWGSCNTKQNISLNFKLLFLPMALANYVLLHELCHTKYLNHSNRFWHLLTQYDSNYTYHDRELKHGDQYVPQWVLNWSS